MEPNWEGFFDKSSSKSYFYLSKEGWRFWRHFHYKGQLLNDLKDINEDELKEYINWVYNLPTTTKKDKLTIRKMVEDIWK